MAEQQQQQQPTEAASPVPEQPADIGQLVPDDDGDSAYEEDVNIDVNVFVFWRTDFESDRWKRHHIPQVQHYEISSGEWSDVSRIQGWQYVKFSIPCLQLNLQSLMTISSLPPTQRRRAFYFPGPMHYIHKLTLMMIAQRETERLDFQHHIFAMTFDGKLQIAPLPETLNRVLDIGTGTGIWAIDFADENPDTQVGT